MKKKAIEKIGYLTLPKVSRKKDVKYVGVTAIRTIDGTDHLFLEVYENQKDKKAVPVVRIVLNDKDFGNYFPKEGYWTRHNIKEKNYYTGFIWEPEETIRTHRTSKEKEDQNILYSADDLKRIKTFLNERYKYWDESWWDYIKDRQGSITQMESREKADRRYERRRQALEERIANTDPLPEQDVLDFAKKTTLKKHFLYYKKTGVRARVACSACGKIDEGRWKQGESYRSSFEHEVPEPRDGLLGICQLCGEVGTYKPQGRAKGTFGVSACVYLGQRYKESGFVMRYIIVDKYYNLEVVPGKKQDEIVGAQERFEATEIARVYFEPGKSVQTDYHKWNYRGEENWDDCNLMGMNPIRIEDGWIMPETYGNMEGICMQYSSLEAYVNNKGDRTNPVRYLKAYLALPQLEMMMKLRLYGVADNFIRRVEWNNKFNAEEKPEELLGIRKDRIRFLSEHSGDLKIWKALQAEKSLGRNWTRQQIESIAILDQKADDLRGILDRIGIQKYLNWIAGYAGCGYENGCGHANEILRQIAGTYRDYLNLRRDLGYDMTNTVYLHPRNLRQAHDRMVEESNQKELDQKKTEKEKQYANIRKNYRKLRRRFYYEDADYIIRPAKSASEIIEEGRMLHHCVGGDSYLSKHNRGETFILFLRLKKLKSTPYVTVEITDKFQIRQWYGAHDKKPDEKNLQRWLDAYTALLICRRDGTMAEAAQEAAMPVLAYA